MLRETIICIIIVIAIIGLDIFTQNFTSKTVSDVSEIFGKIEESIWNENSEILKEQIQEIDTKWEYKQKRLSYYIEHDELEKVKSAIVKMQSYVEADEYPSALAELREGKFVLEHIQEKNSLNLQNIF